MHDFTIIHVITSVKDRGQVVHQVIQVPRHKLANRKRPNYGLNYGTLLQISLRDVTEQHFVEQCKQLHDWLHN